MAEWYYSEGSAQSGPVDAAELARMLREGKVHDGTLVWQDGMPAWEPLAKHRDALIGGGPPPVPSPFAPPRATPNEAPLGDVVSGHPVVYAGFVRRWLALLIDSLVIFVPLTATAVILGLSIDAAGGSGGGGGGAEILLYLLWLIAAPAYYAGCESSAAQATVGKRLLGIKVVDLDGQRLSFLHALGRWFAAALSYISLYIGFLLAAFTERKQALHDFVARTLVVDRYAYTDTPHLQKAQLSGCAIAALVVILGGLFILPILAAIAIPAYSDYVARAKTAEVLAKAGEAKTTLAEFVLSEGRCPQDWSELPANSQPVSALVSEVYVGEFEGGGCGLQFVMAADTSTQLAGKSLYLLLDQDGMTWTCTSEIEPRFLPASCR